MKVAQVVPIRRLPSTRNWFDYSIPADFAVNIGQLVTIPFQNQVILGIIWQVNASSNIKRLKQISSIISKIPFMSTWQMNICRAISDYNCTSLGHVLNAVIPHLPKKFKWPNDHLNKQHHANSIPDVIASNWLWYRHRPEAIKFIKDWANTANHAQQVVITPTIAEAEKLSVAMSKYNINNLLVTSKISAAQYLKVYNSVLSNQKLIIGTSRALTLPYLTRPNILIDQEENISYKMTFQNPRTDIREILRGINYNYSYTSPAPSIKTYKNYNPRIPPQLGVRLLSTLGQVKNKFWISYEVDSLLDSLELRKSRLLLITPQQGYASSIVCDDCNHVISCQNCDGRIRLFSNRNDSAKCANCMAITKLPDRCPKCRGYNWKFTGLGISKIQEVVKEFWPKLTISNNPTTNQNKQVLIDTYKVINNIEKIDNLEAVVIINGDSLRNWPDFSIDERVWQYLSRLQSLLQNSKVIVQTFAPDLNFWQRWVHHDDKTWYNSELASRKKLKLPPYFEQWIALLLTTTKNNNEITKKITEINSISHNSLQAEKILPIRRSSKMYERILITNYSNKPVKDLINCKILFPFPWQLDTSVSSWLD